MAGMLKTKVTNDIEFAYYDSGPPPNKSEYETIVLIHGHTFHSGTFKPMLDQANSFGYRIILPNRRLYPGSTPYTKEESDAFEPTSSTEDKTKAYLKQGEYLLLFVNNVIVEHKLKNVILAAWSLGTGFLNVTVASITAVNEDIQSNLRQAVRAIVWWDPPSSIHGIPDPPTGGWIPLYDESIPPEQRGQVFAQWLAKYYPHRDIDKKDCHTLVYKEADPGKQPTFTGMPFDEFLTMVDLTAGVNGDNHLADKHFQPAAAISRGLGFFDSKSRSAWGNVSFNVIHGEQSIYTVIWAAWQLEKEAAETGFPLKIISMRDANHFAMHDRTKLVFDTLTACT